MLEAFRCKGPWSFVQMAQMFGRSFVGRTTAAPLSAGVPDNQTNPFWAYKLYWLGTLWRLARSCTKGLKAFARAFVA